MIPYADHLLPGNATPLEQAMAAVATRSDAIEFPIRDVWDPWSCPAQFLKSLAHAYSVDLWSDAWTDTRKRSVIANAVKMHRAKGTLYAIRTYLAYVDADLIEAIVPPQRVYGGPSLTREEREAWLEQLPQVRTWRVREAGRKGFGLFCGSASYRSFFEAGFTVPSTAIQRLNRRARWVVRGVETDTRVTQIGSYFRLHIRGSDPHGVFCSTITFNRFYVPSTAAQRLVTIEPKAVQPWRSPVTAHLDAVTSEPERVVVSGTAGRSVFCAGFVGGKYFVPTSAPLRIYWRFAVNDGSVELKRRPASQFMGVGRYGFPAHVAQLRISMPGKRSRLAAGEGVPEPGRTYWLPHDSERLKGIRRALFSAQRASDKLLIRYAGRPAIVAGQAFRAGIDNFVVGLPG